MLRVCIFISIYHSRALASERAVDADDAGLIQTAKGHARESVDLAVSAPECGEYNSVDCTSEYQHAITNGDVASFCNRCEIEGASDPLRSRCQLCCETCSAPTPPQCGALEFKGPGCCRFDHLCDTNEGTIPFQNCSDGCASNPDCVAFDVRCPADGCNDANDLVCTYFYGDDNNHSSVDCIGQYNQSQCWMKDCPAGTDIECPPYASETR